MHIHYNHGKTQVNVVDTIDVGNGGTIIEETIARNEETIIVSNDETTTIGNEDDLLIDEKVDLMTNEDKLVEEILHQLKANDGEKIRRLISNAIKLCKKEHITDKSSDTRYTTSIVTNLLYSVTDPQQPYCIFYNINGKKIPFRE